MSQKVAETRLRVVSIVGAPRSGSTLIGRLLGELGNCCYVGEVRRLWSGFTPDAPHRTCGCGTSLVDCTFWKGVRTFLRENHSEFADPVQNNKIEQDALGLRNPWPPTPGILGYTPLTETRRRQITKFAGLLQATYTAIAEVSGARTLIDSSKKPAFAAVIRLLDDVDVTYLHVVRDPRGVLYSHVRRASADPAQAGPHLLRALHRSASWIQVNAAAAAVRGRQRGESGMLLRYETFAARPVDSLAEVRRLLGDGEPFGAMPIKPDGRATLRISHTTHGNGNRFTHGPVRVEADRCWERDLHPVDRWTSTIVTAPLLYHYRYPLALPGPESN